MTLEEFKLQIETTNKCNNCSHFHLKNKKWTQNLKRNQENSVLYFASAWEVACLELQNSCSLPNMTECGLAFRGGSLDASFSFQIKKKWNTCDWRKTNNAIVRSCTLAATFTCAFGISAGEEESVVDIALEAAFFGLRIYFRFIW